MNNNLKELLRKDHLIIQNSFISRVKSFSEVIEEIFNVFEFHCEDTEELKQSIINNADNFIFHEAVLINGNLYFYCIEHLSENVWHTQINECYFITEEGFYE